MPDTFTHIFGNLVLIETVLVEPQSESGQLSHFSITSIVSSLSKRKDGLPWGTKSRMVFPNKWRSGKGTVGFRSECDIRMDFDTNEYLNIFVSSK